MHRRRIAGALIALVAVTCAGLAIVANPAWSVSETGLVVSVGSVHNGALDVIALALHAAFGPVGGTIILAIAVGWAWMLTGSRASAVRVALVIGLPWLLAEAVKVGVERPRPEVHTMPSRLLAEPPGFSYPSGHTALAAALAMALVLSARSRQGRVWGAAIGAVLVAGTAWSRVYLGVHFPTDVLASIVLVPPVAIAVAGLVGPGSPDRHAPRSARAYALAARDASHTGVSAPSTGEVPHDRGGLSQ